MTVEELAGKISRNFNFIYQINDDYYVLGRDYCKKCSSFLIDVYKGYMDKCGESEKKDNYKRIREYVSDVQVPDKNRESDILKIISEDFENVLLQYEQAMEYAKKTYAKIE